MKTCINEQIIKAMECCRDRECTKCLRLCNNIPDEDDCRRVLIRDAIGLIEQLQFELSEEKAKGGMCAEVIARQDKEIERLEKDYLMYEETTGLKKARTEAVREFAERLKKELTFGRYIQSDQIDALIKEMTETEGGE